MFKQYTHWEYKCSKNTHIGNIIGNKYVEMISIDVQTIQRLKSNVPSLKTALYVGQRLHEYWRSPPQPSNRVRVFCANQYYRHVKSPCGGSI